MEHRYFISDDLDEVEDLQNELLQSGFSNTQVHVLSEDETGLAKHHLLSINSLSKTDVLHSTLLACIPGSAAALAAILIPYNLGAVNEVGWGALIMLAIITFAFFTWEGGLWGIQQINSRFSEFESQINAGNHIMIVDYQNKQTPALNSAAGHHPSILMASRNYP